MEAPSPVMTSRNTLSSNSGVRAHLSNEIAEQNISTVMAIARAMMHHQAVHWPNVANVELWALAVPHAMFILNQMPWEDNGLCPLEMSSSMEYWKLKLLNFHVWGFPVYALNNALAN